MCNTIGKGAARALRFSGATAGPPASSSTRNNPPKAGINEYDKDEDEYRPFEPAQDFHEITFQSQHLGKAGRLLLESATPKCSRWKYVG